MLENIHLGTTTSSSISTAVHHTTAIIPTPDLSFDVSSFIISTTATATPAMPTFEPIVPDTTALLGFGSIVVLCAIAAWVWANQVVPVARTNLARSKRNGPIREYLDELRLASSNRRDDEAVVTFSSNATVATSAETTTATTTTATETRTTSTKNNRSFERWLFTDWLEKAPSKPSALPVLKNAKWNSGDNPVLAATALIVLGVLATAVTERLATTISL